MIKARIPRKREFTRIYDMLVQSFINTLNARHNGYDFVAKNEGVTVDKQFPYTTEATYQITVKHPSGRPDFAMPLPKFENPTFQLGIVTLTNNYSHPSVSISLSGRTVMDMAERTSGAFDEQLFEMGQTLKFKDELELITIIASFLQGLSLDYASTSTGYTVAGFK